MSEELALEGVPEQEAVPAPEKTGKRPTTDWWGEVKGIFWLVLAVLGFHSFIAKPFYIPSESMLPGLQVGDQLIVTKYAYGWSVRLAHHPQSGGDVPQPGAAPGSRELGRATALHPWPAVREDARARRCRDRHPADPQHPTISSG